MSNTQIQSVDQQKAQIASALAKYEGRIREMMPRHLDSKRQFEAYRTFTKTKGDILSCTPMSIVGGIVQAAQLGLTLDSLFGEAFLIPRRNKHQQNVKVASFQIGYKGLRKLALLADPELRDLYAHEVYENDLFQYTYEPPELKYRPHENPDARGKLKYAYAKALWRDGYSRFIVLTTAEINKIKQSSDALQKGSDSPWINWEEAMWRKSALLSLCRTLTLSADSPLGAAMKADERDGDEVAAEMELSATDEAAPAALPQAQGSALDDVANQAEQEQKQTAQQRRRAR